ncbi:MAG: TonB-dependent receptor [Labilithrix sp.]|nr:TonB-dependent receptor [Labilithrix sp.]MCW5813951.1 TonB-dependent receptor [Labilithrix sp.]
MKALLLAVTLLVLSLVALPARADDVADEADHLFTLGAEHYQQRSYKSALQYFLASNRLVRNRNVMFNIAKTYEHLNLRTDIEDVERIEIVRGPGSVLYGTGAFSGVINLVSHSRETPDGREAGVSVADDAVARARVRFTHHWSKDAGVSTSVAAGRGAGRDYFFPELVSRGPPNVAGHARGLDSFRVATWTGKVFYKAFQVQWSFNHHDKYMPLGGDDTIFGDGRNWAADSRGFVEAKFEPKITDWLSSVTRAHANVYFYRSEAPFTPDTGGLSTSEFDGFWVGAEQRFVVSPVKQLRLTGGGEFQLHPLTHQRSDSETLGEDFNQKQDFTLVAGYLLADLLPTSGVKITGGARYDAYSFTAGSINPRLAVIVKPYDGGNVKVMGGKAFRSPSIYERYNISTFGQRENPDLDPENLYSAEVEYSHRFTQTLTASASAYANYITNLIALREEVDDPGIFTYLNTRVPVASLGGEIELRRDWKEGWMASASYSYQKTRYLISDSVGDLLRFKTAPDHREVPNSPSHLAYVKGAVPIVSRALMLMTRLGIEGPRFDVNDTVGTPPQTETQPAMLWDVVFSGTESRWGLSYAIGVYNLFDARWRVPLTESIVNTVPQPGRSVLAYASVVF